jgi:hypothetical protein
MGTADSGHKLMNLSLHFHSYVCLNYENSLFIYTTACEEQDLYECNK